jgi:hypothetical protein
LKAEYEEQAKSHHLYPYITFDDLYNQRIHHTYLPNQPAATTQSGNSR